MNSIHKLEDKADKFFVVDFHEGFKLVPRNWIVQETFQCYWPNVSNPRSYDRQVKSMESLKDTWPLFNLEKIIARAIKSLNLLKILYVLGL